ncbi:metal-binding protein [Aquihabitans sp. G128]|uniref:Ada metal-binding domain-containing protein n=1 Tax=Aquihabitans sp. G128 TaxID=2849779 RepID=UPI001C210BCB|nr:Ada metal-binding domain-containing protein [Aquihabitans sp. G128]QXC60736.1 metal-binding protein [Aquihabitans sp. G128]
MTATAAHPYRLVGADGQVHDSAEPGTLGGHRSGKLYGRLDCRSALRSIAEGGYVADRVFFADEATAIAAGYRPCAVCLRPEYDRWRAAQLTGR